MIINDDAERLGFASGGTAFTALQYSSCRHRITWVGAEARGGDAICEKYYYNYCRVRLSPLSPVLISAEANRHTRQLRPSPVDEGSAASSLHNGRSIRREETSPAGEKPRSREPAAGLPAAPPRLPGPAGRTAPGRSPRCPRGSLSRPEQEVFPGPFPAGRQRCLSGLALPARSRFA